MATEKFWFTTFVIVFSPASTHMRTEANAGYFIPSSAVTRPLSSLPRIVAAGSEVATTAVAIAPISTAPISAAPPSAATD